MNATLKGSIKSKINWLGLAVIVLGYLQSGLGNLRVILMPFIKPELLEALLGLISMAVGIAIIVARFFTEDSLAEKGGGP
jgi:hypothetical protein